MSFLTLNRVASVTLVALAVLGASSGTARADTMFLQCGTQAFTVDLANNTVDNHPATINDTAIDWVVRYSYADGTPGSSQFHIDRTTGAMTSTGTVCFQAGEFKGTCRTTPPSATTCTKGSAPATKF
jgi:hypothetical protein